MPDGMIMRRSTGADRATCWVAVQYSRRYGVRHSTSRRTTSARGNTATASHVAHYATGLFPASTHGSFVREPSAPRSDVGPKELVEVIKPCLRHVGMLLFFSARTGGGRMVPVPRVRISFLFFGRTASASRSGKCRAQGQGDLHELPGPQRMPELRGFRGEVRRLGRSTRRSGRPSAVAGCRPTPPDPSACLPAAIEQFEHVRIGELAEPTRTTPRPRGTFPGSASARPPSPPRAGVDAADGTAPPPGHQHRLPAAPAASAGRPAPSRPWPGRRPPRITGRPATSRAGPRGTR